MIIFTDTGSCAGCQLGACVPHGLGPDIVSSASVMRFEYFTLNPNFRSHLQLSGDNLCTLKEGGSRVLSLILDCSIISAMEMGVLSTKRFQYTSTFTN